MSTPRPLITSVQNPKIKRVISLSKRTNRKVEGLFVVEGLKECRMAIDSIFPTKELYVCPEIIPEVSMKELVARDNGVIIHEVTPKVYARMAYRKTTEGVVGLFKCLQPHFNGISISEKSIIIVLENVEKPGNVGAVLRTADGMGADAVILAGHHTDIFNPNCIRSSAGLFFSIPPIEADNKEILSWLRSNDYDIHAAALPSYENIFSMNIGSKVALVFGAEATGLSDFWLKNATNTFTIPMMGIADSLNLSNSVAIASYEVFRRLKQ